MKLKYIKQNCLNKLKISKKLNKNTKKVISTKTI